MKETSRLLEETEATQLERTCRTTVGDSLRSVTYFTPESFQQIYLRADLESDADLAGFVDHETAAFRARTAYRGSELGEYSYTIRVFDDGYLVSVITGRSGAFVTMDGLTVRRSREAATAMAEMLSDIDSRVDPDEG